MKTLTTINEQIQELLDISENERKSEIKIEKRVLSSRRKSIKFLNAIKFYLESNPTEEFLKSEKKRLKNRLTKIDEAFDSWKHQQIERHPEPLKEYKKLMGVQEIKMQIKSIDFILNSSL